MHIIKKHRNNIRLSHVAFLGLIFYVSKGSGLLPISYNIESLTRNQRQDEPFKKSTTGLILSFLQLANHLWTGYFILEFCVRTAIENKVTCLRGNHCVVYGVFIIHIVVGLLNTLSAIFSHKNSARCLNFIFKLLDTQSPAYPQLPMASFSIIGFMGLLALRLVVNKQLQPTGQLFPLFYYGYYTSYFVPIVVLNLVATLALAAERAYRHVNHQMESLYHAQYEPNKFLLHIQRLAVSHNKTTILMDEISSCFGFSLLMVTIDCFANFVLFLYVTIWTLFVEGIFKDSLAPYLTAMVEIVTIVLKIVFLCYRCDRATYHGKLTMWHLHHLSTRNDLSSGCQQQINIFVMQHKARPVKITALQLFPLNMDLLFKIIGIVSTYFIVLIQFQISNGMKTKPQTVKPQDCAIWPCLGG